ncbi:MAG: hypothetical protein ACRDNG_11230 [Gaiellaceae bacterium]
MIPSSIRLRRFWLEPSDPPSVEGMSQRRCGPPGPLKEPRLSRQGDVERLIRELGEDDRDLPLLDRGLERRVRPVRPRDLDVVVPGHVVLVFGLVPVDRPEAGCGSGRGGDAQEDAGGEEYADDCAPPPSRPGGG